MEMQDHISFRALYRQAYKQLSDESDGNFTNWEEGNGGNPSIPTFTSRMGSRDNTTLVLFIIFMFLTFGTILLRMSCCYQRFATNQQGDIEQSKHELSQEAIEKMLVVKKVKILEPSADMAAQPQNAESSSSKILRRKKSNLILPSNADAELDESRSCPICLCDYENGEEICYSHNSQCPHRFHATCGVAWLAKHPDCPICRSKYLLDPLQDQEVDLESPPTEGINNSASPITINEDDESSNDGPTHVQENEAVSAANTGIGIFHEGEEDTLSRRNELPTTDIEENQS